MSLASVSRFSQVQVFSPVSSAPKKATVQASAIASSEKTTASSVLIESAKSASLYPASAQTAYDAQAIGQNEEAASAAKKSSPAAKKETTAETFLKFAKMTPEQKIRAMFLASEGLTEEDLAALPPKERQKIEDKIEKKIEDAIKRGAGIDPT